jgi:hypothetical protein
MDMMDVDSSLENSHEKFRSTPAIIVTEVDSPRDKNKVRPRATPIRNTQPLTWLESLFSEFTYNLQCLRLDSIWIFIQKSPSYLEN